MNLTHAAELIGTFVFAISGSLAAGEKKLDAFGVSVIAFITALGGGTLRDLLLNLHPLLWIRDGSYLAAIMAGVIFTFLFYRFIKPLHRTFFFFDAIGIGLFTILGLKKALLVAQLSPVVAVIMGMVSATFGGVLRDVLCNEIPLIFRREIYAMACFAGAAAYLLADKLLHLAPEVNMLCTMLLIIAIRLVAVRYRLTIPWRPLGGNE
jgi:uncharacterized membrane protein YeiH